MNRKDVMSFLGNKKVQWTFVAIVLLVVLLWSASIRTSNLPLLKDSTSGEYIPIALDPFYFLRVAETIVENDGSLPEFDALRYNPVRGTGWHSEIMPSVVVSMYRISSIFDSGSDLRYIDVISPVIFYGIGLILFFFMVYVLSRKKSIALLASIFLAFNPAYIYRTMAGFSDHESIGMVAFFIAILIYSIALIYLEKKKTKIWTSAILGVVVALATLLSYASWSGVTFFLFIIVPLSFFLVWIFRARHPDEMRSFSIKGIVFYLAWIVFSILLAPLFSRTAGNIWNLFLSDTNIASLAILVFIIVDFVIISAKTPWAKKQFRLIYSLIGTIILGFIGLFFVGKNPFSLAVTMIGRLIRPFGAGRFGTTVAENAQPFLQNWIGNIGPQIFWLFLFGSFLFGIYLAKKIKSRKRSIIFGALYVFMIFGIVFSKYSETSILNGSNFISQALYVVALLAFWVYFFYLYFHESFEWNARDSVIFALVFYAIVAGRAAARVFFAITPFFCFIAAYLVVQLFFSWKESREEILKTISIVLFILAVVVSFIAVFSSYGPIVNTAESTGPSANVHWQGAMSWIRNNTPEDAVFSHWWDYGYWVQSLGERATVADGGHFQGAEDGNHKIGRYVLTTPNPDTAYAYFKSMNITHLLIDQTDLGKYPAYSKIGSDNDWDRFSSIPAATYDPSKIVETADSKAFVYGIQGVVDKDIMYDSDGDGKTDIFLPGPSFDGDGVSSAKSFVIGILYKLKDGAIEQPRAVYYLNGQQFQIPLRYAYINGEILDYKSGVDAVAYIFPGIIQGASGARIDPMGAAAYLSPMTQKSLFARIYLMNNAFGDYDYLELVHEEHDPVVASIKAQNPNLGEFVYYQGFRGPIKIWKTGYPSSTPVFEEFYNTFDGGSEGFGSLDYLFEN